jgi:hypothetical protein
MKPGDPIKTPLYRDFVLGIRRQIWYPGFWDLVENPVGRSYGFGVRTLITAKLCDEAWILMDPRWGLYNAG